MPRRDTEAKTTGHSPKSKPSWTDVKTRLADLDRLALTGLIQNLYAASKDNQAFLHARFGLGDDVLASYKETIERWLWPDVLRNQNYSVARAKQAISSYRKAVGAPEGLAELIVFFCETAAGFCSALVWMTKPTSMHLSGCLSRLSKPLRLCLPVTVTR